MVWWVPDWSGAVASLPARPYIFQGRHPSVQHLFPAAHLAARSITPVGTRDQHVNQESAAIGRRRDPDDTSQLSIMTSRSMRSCAWHQAAETSSQALCIAGKSKDRLVNLRNFATFPPKSSLLHKNACWLSAIRMPRLIRAAVEVDGFGQSLLERRRIVPEVSGELR
jgi:hypothetical protein